MAVDPSAINDPKLLRNLLENAERRGLTDLVLQCQIRIAELAGRAFDGALEREFWIAVTAAEEFATRRNGRTTKLNRTRQKEKRVGVVQCLNDWALSNTVTEGFSILVDGGRPDLTGEAIVIRHPDKFSESAVKAAKAKLEKHSVKRN